MGRWLDGLFKGFALVLLALGLILIVAQLVIAGVL